MLRWHLHVKLHWTPSAPVPDTSRILELELPTTQHACMALIVQLSSGMRTLPPPRKTGIIGLI